MWMRALKVEPLGSWGLLSLGPEPRPGQASTVQWAGYCLHIPVRRVFDGLV